MFKVVGLNYTYRSWLEKPTKALSDVSFSIPGGAVTAVLGMSGSGKSTLLNVLGLLLDVNQPRSRLLRWFRASLIDGRIDYQPSQATDGPFVYGRLGLAAQNKCRSHHFGFVLQSSYLLPNMRCRYNVELPLLIQNKAVSQRHAALARLLAALSETGDDEGGELEEVLEKKPNSVSTGQRQRMAVLRALIHDPEVVFADEPCASLDPVNKKRVTNLLSNWQQGKFADTSSSRQKKRTLIIVSHDIASACQHAEYFVLLYKGRPLVPRELHSSELPHNSGNIDCSILEKALETGDASLLTSVPAICDWEYAIS